MYTVYDIEQCKNISEVQYHFIIFPSIWSPKETPGASETCFAKADDVHPGANLVVFKWSFWWRVSCPQPEGSRKHQETTQMQTQKVDSETVWLWSMCCLRDFFTEETPVHPLVYKPSSEMFILWQGVAVIFQVKSLNSNGFSWGWKTATSFFFGNPVCYSLLASLFLKIYWKLTAKIS